LENSKNYEKDLTKFASSSTLKTLDKIMYRSIISVGCGAGLYGYNFNQSISLGIILSESSHIRNVDPPTLSGRKISVGNHCFGRTAGQGSTCSGLALKYPGFFAS